MSRSSDQGYSGSTAIDLDIKSWHMDSLMHLIKTRHSTRTAFDLQRPVASADIQKVVEAGIWAPTAHNMQNFELLVVDDPLLLEQLRQIDFPPHPELIQDNYLPLSVGGEEPDLKSSGTLATTFPRSWRLPGLVPEHPNPENIGLWQSPYPGEKDHQLPPAPALILMLHNPGNRAPGYQEEALGLISVGCVLENMWLMAHHLGISVHIVSALSGHKVQPAIKALLQIPAPFEIAIAFRLGYPLADSDSLRVRRDIGELLHYNKFNRNNSHEKKNTSTPD